MKPAPTTPIPRSDEIGCRRICPSASAGLVDIRRTPAADRRSRRKNGGGRVTAGFTVILLLVIQRSAYRVQWVAGGSPRWPARCRAGRRFPIGRNHRENSVSTPPLRDRAGRAGDAQDGRQHGHDEHAAAPQPRARARERRSPATASTARGRPRRRAARRALNAGQVRAARPRRGHGAGGAGRPPLPPSTR